MPSPRPKTKSPSKTKPAGGAAATSHAKNAPTGAAGLDDAQARALVDAWRAFAHVDRAIAKTKTGWQVATTGTQVEYLAGERVLVVRQGVGPNYNALVKAPDALRARLDAETTAQKKLLKGARLDLAVLPYRHLDPLVKPLGVKPTLEIVATRSVDAPQAEGAFIEIVRATMKAAFDWRKKRQLLFHAGR